MECNKAERVSLVIDGMKFSDIKEFYLEMEQLLTKDLLWRTGRNMDAFHDFLRGGFGVHEYGQGIDFLWIHAEKIRADFGYEATELYWQEILNKCHPSNQLQIAQKVKAAKNKQGETLFDMIVQQILCKTSVYQHSLVLDWN